MALYWVSLDAFSQMVPMMTRVSWRRASWILGVTGAVGLLYLLRWPLFGGLVRSELSRMALQGLHADLVLNELDGSLLWSLHASRVVLVPRSGSPLRSFYLQSIHVHYGFFGISGLHVFAEGAKVQLAPAGRPPKNLGETLQDVVRESRALSLPPEIEIVRSKL